jgi:hypothetical protein
MSIFHDYLHTNITDEISNFIDIIRRKYGISKLVKNDNILNFKTHNYKLNVYSLKYRFGFKFHACPTNCGIVILGDLRFNEKYIDLNCEVFDFLLKILKYKINYSMIFCYLENHHQEKFDLAQSILVDKIEMKVSCNFKNNKGKELLFLQLNLSEYKK